MDNFWDYSVWSALNIIAVLLISLLLANVLKKTVPFFKKALMPTSVLAGIIVLIISTIYNFATGEAIFDTEIFGGKGYAFLEIIAYHMLAIGFIASTLQSKEGKMTKERSKEIFNTGVTTVATYLLQGIVGIGITIIASLVISGFFAAAGILLPFGYGQGTGQALNYGGIYENTYGFEGGRNFGLIVAAFGFLCASIGGVIHLAILKKKNPELMARVKDRKASTDIVISDGDSKDGSLGKLTLQIVLCVLAYILTYLVMLGIGTLLPGFKAVIYGFNFLFGVLIAMLVKFIINFFKKKKVIKSEVTNNYLLADITNFCFDLMIVAGISAIRIDLIGEYWAVLLILGVFGLFITYFYNRIVAKKMFPNYTEEQFLAMYGMLTGTASTGVVLLREIDPEFKTPAATNLVYQTLPAMVFGFPIMLLATFAPEEPIWTLVIMAGLFIVMNIILFRSFIFKKRKPKSNIEQSTASVEAE